MNANSQPVVPIFVLSLPRAGSTLLQRIIGAHRNVATTPEPWLLFAPFYARRERGVLSEYGHRLGARALTEAIARASDSDTVYRTAVRAFAFSIYNELADGRPLFLDKTPRYHFVVDELIDTFPEAKLVFLWRNPLAVAASAVETFGSGRWVIHRFTSDLYGGVDRLVRGFQRAHAHAYSLRYEDLTAHPESTTANLFDYLGLDCAARALTAFPNVRATEGRMGDPTGVRRYSEISTEPNDKWLSTMANPWRKAWCRRYLEWLGDDRLEAMGYDRGALLTTVEQIHARPRRLASDPIHRLYGHAYRRVLEAVLR